MSLQVYRQKRDFSKTREPTVGKARGKPSKKKPIFVVQEHWASHHHFDFRLEAFGALKSWAVPKGPSMVPGEKRLAVEVEDHPIDYAKFKGEIPEGEYGAGHVEIWDHGTWAPPANLRAHLKDGDLEFELRGEKLKGRFLLRRTGKSTGRRSQWLLIKRSDPQPAAEPKKPAPARKGKEPFPAIKSPQLALLAKKPPRGERWIHEIKWDGYRSFLNVRGREVSFITRSGLDWTEKYKPLDREVRKLGAKSAIFDGEIVYLDEEGHSRFAGLQDAMARHDMSHVVVYLFDLLYWNGHDLRAQPLEERKKLLKEIIKKGGSEKILFSEHWRVDGDEILRRACEEGWEGVVSKDRHGRYTPDRTDAWQKTKCSLRQEFVIGGYTDPEGEREKFGALLMGAYEQGKFRYVGKVGTGFTMKGLSTLFRKMEPLEVEESPFGAEGPRQGRGVLWLKPKLVAEIEFKTWTNDGILRHASFQGLREDKPAWSVVVREPTVKNGSPAAAREAREEGFHITHPERVIYGADEITKMDVASYYKSVAPWILKHIDGRPLALVRCPERAGERCFFQ
jgi:bifunctional non-homologous end joining protein LigD